MDKYSERLDGVFLALADPTRRAVLGRLRKGPASTSELAEPFGMALPSFLKHIHCLEKSGLIMTRKRGRVRTCALGKQPYALAQGWLDEQREAWENRLDRLEAFVTNKKEKSK